MPARHNRGIQESRHFSDQGRTPRAWRVRYVRDIPASAKYEARAKGVQDTLRSHFLEMPRGANFLDRKAFADAYTVLRREVACGKNLTAQAVLRSIEINPRAWVVLRCVLGMSPGEAAWLASVTAEEHGETVVVSQDLARQLDVQARRGNPVLLTADDKAKSTKAARDVDRAIREMVPRIVEVISTPAPTTSSDRVHRLDKLDTSGGLATLKLAFSEERVPYVDLLYERALGRPYASHRDSVSGEVGDLVDLPLMRAMTLRGVSFYRPRSREAIPTFPQAPDFLVPSREKPRLIIEDKLTEDDGTARDKVARLQTLRQYEDDRPPRLRRTIVAVIDGRGFLHRSADLAKMLDACKGYVYTLTEIPLLFESDGPLAKYVGTADPDQTADSDETS